MLNRYSAGITVVPHRPEWQDQARAVEVDLRAALRAVPIDAVEHVGSTAVPGLAAKPILDVDVIVQREVKAAAMAALQLAGYEHCGDLGLADREAFNAPDEHPAHNMYLCVADTLHLRNHLAVRDTLRCRADLRERYGAVKLQLARQPDMDIERYLAGKSAVLQEVLALSDLTEEERQAILAVNPPA